MYPLDKFLGGVIYGRMEWVSHGVGRSFRAAGVWSKRVESISLAFSHH